jgi:hypothetical protein
VVSSSCQVVRVSFLGRVVRMVVRWYFGSMGPLVHRKSKDTYVGVNDYREDNHTWGHMSE